MGAKDLTGQRFGKLVVLGRNFEEQKLRNRRDIFWNCACNCGNVVVKMGWEINKMQFPSCGQCILNEIVGKRYGMLTILSYSHTEKRNDASKGGRRYFKCQCDCGNIITVQYSHLISGHTQSCGCLKTSLGEKIIQDILTENHISFKREYSFSDLKDTNLLRYDFAILNKSNAPIALVEFDGPQHIEGHNFTLVKDFDQELLLKHDMMKNEYALSHNLPLIRIPYKDKRKDKIEEYLKNFL